MNRITLELQTQKYLRRACLPRSLTPVLCQGVKPFLFALLILFNLVVSQSPVLADNSRGPFLIRDVAEAEDVKLVKIILPFALYSDTYQFTVGIAGGATGFQEGQMGLYGIGLYTTNGTAAIHLMGNDIRIPYTQRLFLDSYLSYGWYARQRDYVDGNPDFPDEQAGSNDSSADNYIFDAGYNNTVELRFKYVLPIGQGRGSAMHAYIVDRGLLVEGASGGKAWNPMTNGISYLQIKPFFRHRTNEQPGEELTASTSGVEAGLHYDNRDFPMNPSSGSKMHLTYAGDFGNLNNWSVLKGQLSKYVSLGESDSFRQRVIALDLWVADNFNRKTIETAGDIEYEHRAIPGYGAALGGLHRLRAYPKYRFHDKVAIYYGAEYRVIPRWNPLANISWLSAMDVDWWQVVGIAELGRVDTSWSADTFFKDLHWSAGAGLRLMTRKVVVRLDVAFSDEGGTMWVMAGQAF
jgi:hypothetical protein